MKNLFVSIFVMVMVTGCGVEPEGMGPYMGATDSDGDTDSDTDSDSDSDTDECEDGARECADDDSFVICAGGEWSIPIDCPTGMLCDHGECVAPSCEDGEMQCDELVVQICFGGSWYDIAECEDSCEDGECVETSECEDDARECTDANSFHICVDGDWSTAYDCPSGMLCDDGFCVAGSECDNGDRRCADVNTVEVCVAGHWEILADCPSGQFCEDGQCEALGCTDGARQCDGNTVELCVSGSWYDLADCPSGQACVAGFCQDASECTSGTFRCLGNQAQACVGGFWSTIDNCTTTENCVATTTTAYCDDSECGEWNDWYCPAGETCIAGECVADETECIWGDPDHQCGPGFACTIEGNCVPADCSQSTDCSGSAVCWVISTRFESIGGIVYRWKFDGICGARPSGSLGTWDRGYRTDMGGGTCEYYGYGFSPDVIEQTSIPTTFQCQNGHAVPITERCVPAHPGYFTFDRECAGQQIGTSLIWTKSFVEP